MALLPYLFDDLRPRPRRLQDQLFGLDLSPDDFLMDLDLGLNNRSLQVRKYLRPWRNLAVAVKDVGSTIKSDKDKFQINVDVQHFDPEEISVKTADGYVVIEGKHEERKDEHGFVSRHFTRRYALPERCNPEAVESRLSSDGVLTVTAPKVSESRDERSVPILQTGPVRRKLADDEEPDEKEKETNTQKKRRK